MGVKNFEDILKEKNEVERLVSRAYFDKQSRKHVPFDSINTIISM